MTRAKVSRTRNAAQTSTGGTGGGVGVFDATDAPSFSRPVSMPTAEKNTVTVKTCITDTMDDDLRRFAREHGYSSVSDCVREVLRLALYGQQHVLDLHQQRVRALARNLATTGTTGGQ